MAGRILTVIIIVISVYLNSHTFLLQT